jgi:hypothetical protein
VKESGSSFVLVVLSETKATNRIGETMEFNITRFLRSGMFIALGFGGLVAGLAAAVPAQEKSAGKSVVEAELRQPDGDGKVALTGELKQWHKVTLTMDGPFARETDTEPNPFIDYRMTVTFTHESGQPSYTVPGYFAADGDAGNTSATEGTKWRAHLAPDKAGRWKYEVNFATGKQAALGTNGTSIKVYDREKGRFKIEPSDKRGNDFRAKGRLQYVGSHYLQFAGSKEYFLKAGPDAPETLLGYADFDGTVALKPKVPMKTWQKHVRDWKAGDPTWKDGKGKGLIGAVNYLAAKGLNVMSFLTYNAGGDGDNVWPFISRDDKLHYDCSKLDQWGVVFDHAQTKGIYLHFKLQENETDDNLKGHQLEPADIPEALDGGDLGSERKLYLRELIARYGYELALNWNLGEENTQTPAQQRAMAKFIADTDPYQHHIVVHTFPDFQDRVYPELLGDKSVLTGASLQNSWSAVHQRTLKWVQESVKAGKPWVVANDEQGPAGLGVPPDPGYDGFLGIARDKPTDKPYDLHSIRKHTLWGNLMAGGAGVEYYFGYKLPQNDLVCEDFRSRERSWSYCRVALSFFPAQSIPFWEMTNADALIGNEKQDNSKYCFAKADSVYLVYLPEGGTSELDLTAATGKFTVKWFNPRSGGPLRNGSVSEVNGGGKVALGQPPGDATEDWLAVVRK